MRLFFWIVTTLALVAAVLGWTALDPPSMQDVAGAVMGEWYRQQMIWAALIGLAAGGVGGWMATRRVKLRPRTPSTEFFSRVAGYGVRTATVAGLLVLVVSAVLAFNYASVPVSPMERIGLLLGAGRFVAVIGLGVFAATAAFGGTIRSIDWSGRYALVSY